eukprot:12893677-Prorocentrum_lima.AAC.1
MPTSDLSRMSMAREFQTPWNRVPATLSQMGNWLEDYMHKLDFGIILGALLEPRTVLTVLRDTMEPTESKDELLRKCNVGRTVITTIEKSAEHGDSL